MDELAHQFLQSHQESDAINLIRLVRCSGLHNLGMTLGKFLEKQFPHSVEIKDEYAINSYYNEQYVNAYDIYDRLLKFRNLPEDVANRALFNAHFSIDHIENRYIHYAVEKITQIAKRRKKTFPLITLTVTSCKRFDLFEKTINSFLNCCTDIDMIDEWICVDDNSSHEDRDKMEKLYPFFTFYFKTIEEKGHPQSMNIIRRLVKTPYIFHMEDDWKFFTKRRYLTDCMDVLGQNQRIGQCLINKNFAEIESDISIKGGGFQTTRTGLRYYMHEFAPTPELQKEWKAKHGDHNRHCNYWPHFSFRPSLIRTKILQELGEFNELISHFEMDYSNRYVHKGYLSAFLEGIYSLHIGRLTSERNDKTKPNAYELNDESQFEGKEHGLNTEEKKEDENCAIKLEDFDIKLKTYILNLDRRPDRWDTFQSKATDLAFLKYERFSAIDGNNLVSTPQLQRIFDGNDYNMRMGMVGCAMSHIKMYIELIYSDYDAFCILEDDLEFVPDFDKKLLHVYNQVKTTQWDMLYLGHHLFNHCVTPETYDKTQLPLIAQWSRTMSLSSSMGGTGGYLISKTGAKKLLAFISKTGMTNGIDTVQQKSADELNIFYTSTHLFYSECFTGDNNPDTDIQYNYTSLTVPLEKRLEEEKKYHGTLLEMMDLDTALSLVQQIDCPHGFYCGKVEDVNKVKELCIHPYYTLEKTVILVIPGSNIGRYFDRLKKGDVYNIDDALIYRQNI